MEVNRKYHDYHIRITRLGKIDDFKLHTDERVDMNYLINRWWSIAHKGKRIHKGFVVYVERILWMFPGWYCSDPVKWKFDGESWQPLRDG